MRKLIYLVFLLAFGWAAWWLIGSTLVERGLRAWVEERREAGWVAGYESLNTRGFPSRFDTIVTGLELADPRAGVAWSVPRLEILMLSYRPNHIIVELPGTQQLATPLQKIEIAADPLRGSLVFAPDTDLALERSAFEFADMWVSSTLGWEVRIASGRFASRLVDPADPLRHQVSFEASDLTPSDALRRRLDPAALLPEQFAVFAADFTVLFSAPWDRHAIEEARPQPRAIELELVQAKWGDLDLRVAGEVTIDEAGVPDGEITVRAENWREMLDLAVASGVLPEGLRPTLERILELVAGGGGGGDTLDAPLTFRDGRVSFGPIPLGPAPRLVIR